MNRRHFVTASLGLLIPAVTLSRGDGMRRYITHWWRHCWFDYETKFATALTVRYFDENGDVQVAQNAARTHGMQPGMEQNAIAAQKQILAYWAEHKLHLPKEHFV